MTTAEGTFPKDPGDPLYASEVNRMNMKLIDSKYIYLGVYTSGTTAYTTMGSILYPGAGSLGISDFIYTDFSIHDTKDLGYVYQYRLRISGTAGLDFNTSGIPTAGYGQYSMKHIWTSGAITTSGGNIGSPYIISIEGNSADPTPGNHRIEELICWGI